MKDSMDIEFRNQAIRIRDRIERMSKAQGIYDVELLEEARANMSDAVWALNVTSDYERAVGCFAKACALVGIVLGKVLGS